MSPGPLQISSVATAIGLNGFSHKDLAAIKRGAVPNGFFYEGGPVTPGFAAVAQTGYSLSLMLRLTDGSVAFGDCVDVIFAGAAGRDPLFDPNQHLDDVKTHLVPALVGRDVSDFRTLAEELDRFRIGGRPMHTALRYGLSQALLHAAAIAQRATMAEVIARAYGTEVGLEPLPILVSIPKTDPLVLDRMIMKRVELLPHASFTAVEADLGADGGKLIDYAAALSRRISEVGGPDYRPSIHLDTYGTIGELFGNDVGRIASYLATAAEAASPYPLLIESPIIAETMDGQIGLYRALRQTLRERGVPVRIVVDEWCNTGEDVRRFAEAEAADFVQIKAPDLGGLTNTIEAILYCRSAGIGCCLGGTANETDQSARITAHVGMACRPDFLLGKPGLGGDAGLMILRNEMSRITALLQDEGRVRGAPLDESRPWNRMERRQSPNGPS